LGAQIVDGGDPFLRRFTQPVGQVIVCGSTLLQAISFDGLLYHGFTFPYFTVEETVLMPNAGAHLLPEAGATQERTLEAVRCSALLARTQVCPVLIWYRHGMFPWLVKMNIPVLMINVLSILCTPDDKRKTSM
jgi:hypothetical protein